VTTTVLLRRVSGPLGTGHYAGVTKAVSRMEHRRHRKLAQVRRKLLRIHGEDAV
jgi:hypothetical protein